MATAKKTTTKKPAAKKAPAKKTTAKASTAKKPVARKAPAKKSATKKPEYISFRPSEEKTPFFTFKATDQTVYWLVLSTVVFVLSLWVLHLHLEVIRISAGI